jgi:hypothetical protein
VSAEQLKAMMARLEALQAQVNAKPAKDKPTDPNVIGCATIREPNDQYGASIKYQPSFTTFPTAGVQKAVKFWRDLLDHVDDVRAAVERAEKLFPEVPKSTDDKPRTRRKATQPAARGETIVI